MASAAAIRDDATSVRCDTVLIIGADARTRNAHAIALQTHGYEVECADCTQVALQTYAANPPALVLFAIDEHDGATWDVLRKIRRDYPRQRIAYALNGSQRLCGLSVGGVERLKAQGPDDLISVVEGLIGPAAASTTYEKKRK